LSHFFLHSQETP